MSVYEKLLAVQGELKAPKGQYNSFGKYKYRSCEDIVEAVKPLLFKYKAAILLDDEIVEVAGRFYIKATAQFIDCEDGNIVSTNAYAREDESKKGMDGAQVTGTSSSYARKYALNGLLAIDDTKDADATNTHGHGEQTDNRHTTPAIPAETEQPCTCEACGKQIRDARNSAGEIWKAKDIAVYTKLRFNRKLCVGCMSKEPNDENAG